MVETARGMAVSASPRAYIGCDEPFFPKQRTDDRTRTLAVVWLLKHKQPDLLLIHLIDRDSDQHV